MLVADSENRAEPTALLGPPLRHLLHGSAAAPVRLFDVFPLRRYALLRYGGLSLMEPRIQYAQTKDGVSIAFWTLATASHKPQQACRDWRGYDS